MSQPPLSSDPTGSKLVPDPEIAEQLNRYFREDLQPDLARYLLLKLKDPITAGPSGGFRLSVLWAGLGALGAMVLSVFVYFNFVKS